MSGPRRKQPPQAHKVAGGPTIYQKVNRKLDQAMVKYLEDPTDQKRGIVRGLAIAAAIYRNPYNPNPKAAERESKARHRATPRDEEV